MFGRLSPCVTSWCRYVDGKDGGRLQLTILCVLVSTLGATNVAIAQSTSSPGQNWSSSWGFSSSSDRSVRLQAAQIIRNAATSSGPTTVITNNYDYRTNYQEVITGGDSNGVIEYQIGDEIGQNTNAIGAMNTGETTVTINGDHNTVDATNSADSDGCINGSVLNETLSLLETLTDGGDIALSAASAARLSPCG